MLVRAEQGSRLFSVIMLFLLAACGKQGPKLTPLQKVETTYKEFSEKYKKEIDVLNKYNDDDTRVKELGKVIANKKLKFSALKYMVTDIRLTAQNIPFHTYEGKVAADACKMKDIVKKLAGTPCFDAAQLLYDTLYEIGKYVKRHKEYRAEDRYKKTLHYSY